MARVSRRTPVKNENPLVTDIALFPANIQEDLCHYTLKPIRSCSQKENPSEAKVGTEDTTQDKNMQKLARNKLHGVQRL